MTVLFCLADGAAWAQWAPLARRLAARGHAPYCWLERPDHASPIDGLGLAPTPAPTAGDDHWRAVMMRIGADRHRLRSTGGARGRSVAVRDPRGGLPWGAALGRTALEAVLGAFARSRAAEASVLRELAGLDPDVIVGDAPGHASWTMGDYIPAARQTGRHSVVAFPPSGALPAAMILEPSPSFALVWTAAQEDHATAVNGLDPQSVRLVDGPGWDGASAVIEALGRLPRPAPEGAGAAVLLRPVASAVVAARRAVHASRRWHKRGKRFTRKAASRAVQGSRRWARASVRRHLAPAAGVLEPGRPVAAAASDLDCARLAREHVADVAARRGPIIVGPWLSEAGFELLYWIPFVRWAKAYAGIREDRLVVVSRGGVRPWYGDITSRYIELFTLFRPDEFRRRNTQRIQQLDGEKQFEPSPFDVEIRDRVVQQLGGSEVGWLHPGVMYNLFKPFWMQAAPLALVQAYTAHRRLPRVGGDPVAGLPARYVVAKFYTNAGFPDTPDNRRFVRRVLERLAERHMVVLLNTGIGFDDHGEFDGLPSSRIVMLREVLTAEANLCQQTRVIEGADAYVGTYGGFSYVAPLAGVDAVTFYSEPSAFRQDHLGLAERVFSELACGRFLAASTSDLPFLEDVLGGAVGPSGPGEADRGVVA